MSCHCQQTQFAQVVIPNAGSVDVFVFQQARRASDISDRIRICVRLEDSGTHAMPVAIRIELAELADAKSTPVARASTLRNVFSGVKSLNFKL